MELEYTSFETHFHLAPFSELCCSWWGYRKDVGIEVSKERRNLQSSKKSTTITPELPQIWITDRALRRPPGPKVSSISPALVLQSTQRAGVDLTTALGFFLSTINDTLESKDNSKDFALKGRVWFHVQSRLPQKPAVSNEDFKALSCPCDTRHLWEVLSSKKRKPRTQGTRGKEHNITTLQHFPGKDLLQTHFKGLFQSSSPNNGHYSWGTKGCCHIIPLWEGTSSPQANTLHSLNAAIWDTQSIHWLHIFKA